MTVLVSDSSFPQAVWRHDEELRWRQEEEEETKE